LGALRAGRWADHVISALTLVPAALPEFVAGALFIAIGFSWLGWFPPVSLVPPGSSPLATPDVLVLPVLTLLAVTVGPASRMIRAGMLESLKSEWVRAARLNGVSERWVVVGYGLRNSIAPSIQVFALIAQYLIGGLIIVEYLFDFPGLGKELVTAVNARDSIEVQSVTMLLATAIVAITIIADLLVILMVPSLRTEWA
jgi:peptide/nickel transport system permease protein